MKTILYILSIILFVSCTTAYKSGQTPDDIYYSKPRTVVENNLNVHTDNVYEERQIRMAAYDYRWRTLNDRYDYNYNYSPYNYGYNYGYYFNPYYYPFPVYANNGVFVNPKNTTIRTTNLNAYNNTISTYTATKGSGNVRTTTVRGYNNSNNQTIRNTDTRTYTEPRSETRTYSPSSGNSSNNSNSSSPSQGSSVPMPRRGGN